MDLHGYLILTDDGMIGIDEDRDGMWPSSIQQLIKCEYGSMHVEKGLGQDITTIPECSLRIYFTDEKCTLEEVEELVADVFDGGLLSTIALTGYSEYTITGCECEDFRIGGHDLDRELRDHLGQYCWFILRSCLED